ncbi:S-adenosyl-L-methionine-dependent methyltransferase [Dimargaris cristalligena]|uniref:Protein-lysine N-methyltransferase EFM4 n=1 Tax=Dimargaris cristalligena TaxID=215637 RepID=A0A4P9ZWJ5_9FUNG|nr:S-adenosyl-L-methionine-dependent methyltransferase [Dimargaris cristalligena]|eukprot:RKP37698.1 S-adenosyl-L-methionine-dependent methyltransferase [Dimargaris cristalligena]
MSLEDSSDFGPSELGTREYWDNAYDREVTNFNDHGDIGEVWFGEESVEKMVEWLETHRPNQATSPTILDLGCGNGHLLLELADRDYTQLHGLDYSERAVALARTIATTQLGQLSPIQYHQVDMLQRADLDRAAAGTTNSTGLADVVLDKGTFDAISLGEPLPVSVSAAAEVELRDPKQLYVEAVLRLLKDDGVLLITSCNWTQAELQRHFSDHLVYHDHVPYRAFTFGGVQGQKICTVAFTKHPSKPTHTQK